jgi:formylmethanofuran dehydrogenase subunit D
MIEALLISARTIGQGEAMEISKLSSEYKENTAICEIDKDDMAKLGVKDGDNVRVTSKTGDVVLRAVTATQGPHEGIVFVPLGPWANSITGTGSDSTGMPPFKGIPVQVEAAKDAKVKSAKDLMAEVYNGL